MRSGYRNCRGKKFERKPRSKNLNCWFFNPSNWLKNFFSRGEGIQIVFTTACSTKVILANKQTILELKTRPSQDSITLKKTRSRVFMNKFRRPEVLSPGENSPLSVLDRSELTFQTLQRCRQRRRRRRRDERTSVKKTSPLLTPTRSSSRQFFGLNLFLLAC